MASYKNASNIVINSLLGIAIGDALGVPVEFVGRNYLHKHPITEMTGYGSHNQPKGTWSDDSSLSFCLADSLVKGFNLNDISQTFVLWFTEDYWTARNEVFDVGRTTSQALQKLISGVAPTKSGTDNEMDNGNGSLMRILPLAFYIKEFSVEKRFHLVKLVSSITHSHTRTILCCFIYLEICIQIIKGETKSNAYYEAVAEVNDFCKGKIELEKETIHLKRILNYLLEEIPQNEIYSSGYVVHSLEAALWCWLKYNSFQEIVLKAVNLGDDSDTVAAIAGGLAGMTSSIEEIPSSWINDLARSEDIMFLGEQLHQKYF